MQDRIRKKTEELMELVKGMDAYGTYLKSLKEIRGDEDLYRRFTALRRHTLFMDESGGDDESTLDRAGRLYDEYEDILCLPSVTAFLSAERHILSAMRLIYGEIANQLQLDIAHLDGGGDR